MSKGRYTDARSEKGVQFLADEALVLGLPDPIKRYVDACLSHGRSKEWIRAKFMKVEGTRGLNTLAVEAYLGADQGGNFPELAKAVEP